MIGLCLRRAIQ